MLTSSQLIRALENFPLSWFPTRLKGVMALPPILQCRLSLVQRFRKINRSKTLPLDDVRDGKSGAGEWRSNRDFFQRPNDFQRERLDQRAHAHGLASRAAKLAWGAATSAGLSRLSLSGLLLVCSNRCRHIGPPMKCEMGSVRNSAPHYFSSSEAVCNYRSRVKSFSNSTSRSTVSMIFTWPMKPKS